MTIGRPFVSAKYWLAGFLLLGCTTPLAPFEMERLQQSLPTLPSLATTSATLPLLYDEPSANLPGPANLFATRGELRSVALHWEPLLQREVAGYVIERSLTEAGPFEPIDSVTDRFTSHYIDLGHDENPKYATDEKDLGDGAHYFYQVRGFNLHGELGIGISPMAQGSTANLPDSLEGLRAYSHLPKKIALTWLPSDNLTVSAYRLYRSPSARGPFEPIVDVLGRFNTSHIDEDRGNLRVFYYQVAPLNAAGGEGTIGSTERAVTKAEPFPPKGLRIEQSLLGAVHLSWEHNDEPDLEGYTVRRLRDDGKIASVIATLAPNETWTVDTTIATNEKLTYNVVAFDIDELESEPSESMHLVTEGYQLTGEVTHVGIALHWQLRPEEGFDFTRIYRFGLLGKREIAQVRGSHYLDRRVLPGKRYRYSVGLASTDGAKAPHAQVLEINVPLDWIPPAPQTPLSGSTAP